MSDMSIDRITFLLNANREAGRKLREQFQRRGQEHDKAKPEQARLDEIAATQRKHAEEAVDVVMRAGADRLIE
jgi:diacylglycerol kinase family enzyme